MRLSNVQKGSQHERAGTWIRPLIPRDTDNHRQRQPGEGYALVAMEDELREVMVAMKLEGPERVKSELKDLLATAWRTYGDEHK